MTYPAAGVDIDAGNALVRRIAPMAARTARPGSLGGLGALFDVQVLCLYPAVLRRFAAGERRQLHLGP